MSGAADNPRLSLIRPIGVALFIDVVRIDIVSNVTYCLNRVVVSNVAYCLNRVVGNSCHIINNAD